MLWSRRSGLPVTRGSYMATPTVLHDTSTGWTATSANGGCLETGTRAAAILGATRMAAALTRSAHPSRKICLDVFHCLEAHRDSQQSLAYPRSSPRLRGEAAVSGRGRVG